MNGEATGQAMILLAGGSGRRMGAEGAEKVWSDLGGQPVWRWSWEAIRESRAVDWVILVVRDESQRARVETDLQENKKESNPLWKVVFGGTERQDSVWAGLQAVPEEMKWVGIHDGARPLVKGETIRSLFALARRDGAACLAHPVTDTIKREDDGKALNEGGRATKKLALTDLPRDRLWAMETPQVFARKRITEAYGRVIREKMKITDDAAAWSLEGGQISLLANPDPNPKLTIPADRAYLEYLLFQKKRG